VQNRQADNISHILNFRGSEGREEEEEEKRVRGRKGNEKGRREDR